MTAISRDTVLKLASLSSLQLADNEIDELRTDIERILEYVEQLNELDTTSADIAYQVTGLENIMRKDQVEESPVSRETLLSIAPDSKDSQIKVPKVL